MWHLPNDPDTHTTRQPAEIVYRAVGRGRARVRRVPSLLIRPAMPELAEMRYLFGEPFVMDSSRIAGKLGVRATPLDEALAQTLAGYRR